VTRGIRWGKSPSLANPLTKGKSSLCFLRGCPRGKGAVPSRNFSSCRYIGTQSHKTSLEEAHQDLLQEDEAYRLGGFSSQPKKLVSHALRSQFFFAALRAIFWLARHGGPNRLAIGRRRAPGWTPEARKRFRCRRMAGSICKQVGRWREPSPRLSIQFPLRPCQLTVQVQTGPARAGRPAPPAGLAPAAAMTCGLFPVTRKDLRALP
jgi:hypothetical protein